MNWKGLAFTLMAGLMLAPFSATQACGWDPEWEMDFYRFYEPEFDGLWDYKPFHFTFDRLYDYELLQDSASQRVNVESWKRYLGPAVKVTDIAQVIYGISLDELAAIHNHPQSGMVGDLAHNTLLAEWKAGRHKDVLDYMILAHQAQPFCTFAESEWGYEERNFEGIDRVIGKAVAASKTVADPFLKLRYAYQAVRLQQYAGQNELAIESYRTLALPHAAADPLIANWALCHYAGCLRNLELEAEAAYAFSRVFDQCPSRRVQAWYSWRINSDEIWESVQAKCKNNHEMAVLYFLRGYAADSDPLDDMRQIHELDPGSKMLEVLLLREINRLESDLLGNRYSNDAPLQTALAQGAGKDLKAFTEEVMASGKMHDRNVWQLAHIYLHFLGGNIAAASAELKEKQDGLSPEGQLKGRLMDLVFRIAATKTVDRSVENTILKDYTNLSAKLSADKAEQLASFRDGALAWLYEAQGEKAKALLARNNAWQLVETPIDVERINDMLAFQAKADKTLYEKELLSRLDQGEDTQNWLLEAKGTGLLARNLLPEAIKVFESIPQSYRDASESFTLEADPFRSVTRDVVNCEDCGDDPYTKLTFAQALVTLQKKAFSEPSKAAEYNMLLGNAYYNTSYFGAAWRARDYYRSSGSWWYMGSQEEGSRFDVDSFEEIVNMDLPKDYYLKALKASKDKEMGALAAFMVAKCELNQSYLDGINARNAYEGFAKLKTAYRKTDVFKELIQECWYLQSYVASK